jgi:hypothetical protein
LHATCSQTAWHQLFTCPKTIVLSSLSFWFTVTWANTKECSRVMLHVCETTVSFGVTIQWTFLLQLSLLSLTLNYVSDI